MNPTEAVPPAGWKQSQRGFCHSRLSGMLYRMQHLPAFLRKFPGKPSRQLGVCTTAAYPEKSRVSSEQEDATGTEPLLAAMGADYVSWPSLRDNPNIPGVSRLCACPAHICSFPPLVYVFFLFVCLHHVHFKDIP